TDSTGAVQNRYDYRPFGQMIPQGVNGRPNTYPATESPGTGDGWTMKFTGKERDSESVLDYFGARYFSGPQGRFTGPDQPLIDQQPGDPQSWNLYGYVRNSPLNYVDLSGEDCVYTDEFGSNGTVTVERGDCSRRGGTFFNGTIDLKSLTYDTRRNRV